MISKPTLEELSHRICREVEHFGGNLPERNALVWSGYISGLLEWGMITVEDHADLCKLLPPIENDPTVGILLGKPGARYD